MVRIDLLRLNKRIIDKSENYKDQFNGNNFNGFNIA